MAPVCVCLGVNYDHIWSVIRSICVISKTEQEPCFPIVLIKFSPPGLVYLSMLSLPVSLLSPVSLETCCCETLYTFVSYTCWCIYSGGELVRLLHLEMWRDVVSLAWSRWEMGLAFVPSEWFKVLLINKHMLHWSSSSYCGNRQLCKECLCLTHGLTKILLARGHSGHPMEIVEMYNILCLEKLDWAWENDYGMCMGLIILTERLLDMEFQAYVHFWCREGLRKRRYAVESWAARGILNPSFQATRQQRECQLCIGSKITRLSSATGASSLIRTTSGCSYSVQFTRIWHMIGICACVSFKLGKSVLDWNSTFCHCVFHVINTLMWIFWLLPCNIADDPAFCSHLEGAKTETKQ